MRRAKVTLSSAAYFGSLFRYLISAGYFDDMLRRHVLVDEGRSK
jgi:hypothetical protein